jgi:hypothetical protein
MIRMPTSRSVSQTSKVIGLRRVVHKQQRKELKRLMELELMLMMN